MSFGNVRNDLEMREHDIVLLHCCIILLGEDVKLADKKEREM
jgi:hypothetical protein